MVFEKSDIEKNLNSWVLSEKLSWFDLNLRNKSTNFLFNSERCFRFDEIVAENACSDVFLFRPIKGGVFELRLVCQWRSAVAVAAMKLYQFGKSIQNGADVSKVHAKNCSSFLAPLSRMNNDNPNPQKIVLCFWVEFPSIFTILFLSNISVFCKIKSLEQFR
jgi:hypothetical protein